MKKQFAIRSILLAMAMVLLLATASIGVSAGADASPFHGYADGVLTFTAYTEGAEKAFDGDEATGYDGSITGVLANPSMLSGVCIKAVDTITDITVKVSADGVNWNTVYELNKATKKLSAEFGGAGPDVAVTTIMREEMYTYVAKYIRVETGSGEIAELSLFGYAVDITGQEIALDTSYGTNGYTVSLSHYNPPKTEYITDHSLGGSWENGDAIKPVDGDETKTGFYAVKLAKPTKLTEVVIAPRQDCSKENIANRFNAIYLDASVDGANWVTLLTTPEDYSTQYTLANNTVHVWTISDSTEYQYVRLRSDLYSVGKGWLTFSEFNVYGAGGAAVTAPANVLKGWEGDPHVAAEADVTTAAPTEEVAPPTEAPTAEAEKPTTEPSNGTQATGDQAPSEKKGCGASFAGGALALLAVIGCGVTARKRKEN